MTRDQLIQWAEEKAKNLLCEAPADEDHSELAAALVEAYEAGMRAGMDYAHRESFKAGMELACKVVCQGCDIGLPLVVLVGGEYPGTWHENNAFGRIKRTPCAASAIRAAMEEGKP